MMNFTYRQKILKMESFEKIKKSNINYNWNLNWSEPLV